MIGGWLGLGSLLVVASWAPASAACSQPVPGWAGSLQTAQVPTDGVVIVSYTCYSPCGELEPTITVRDKLTGAEVPGTLAPLPDVPASLNVYGWRPTTALTAGAFYDVELPLTGGSATRELSAVAPTTPALETFTVVALHDVAEYGVGDQVCCPGGPLNTCGTGHCYYPRVRRGLSILLDWSTTPELAHWGQYLYRVAWEGQTASDDWLTAVPPRAVFDTEQAEYCYTLELKSLIDGSIVDLERTCVPHAAGEVLGEADQDPALIRNQLAVCDAPPAGIEDEWCVARAERCTLNPYDQCEAPLALYCEDAGGTGGTSGSGGSSGTGGSPGAGGGVTGPSNNADDDGGGGCSATPYGAGKHGRLAAVLALAGLVLARRRRALARPR